jgi:hypothetical protein
VVFKADRLLRRDHSLAGFGDGGLDELVRRYLKATDDPVECRAFWRELADLGVIEERLMNRMGASP